MGAPQKPKVLLLGIVEFAHDAWSSLQSIVDIIETESTTRDEFLAECKKGAFQGMTAIYRTFDSFSITGRIDDEILAALPPTLKFIAHGGAGYDQIDIQACTAHAVRVSNTPTAVDDSTADVAIWLLLGCLRNLNVAAAALRHNHWRGKTPPGLGHDPQGKILGILGMGGIGRNMAKKVKAFGMRVRYHNRARLDPEMEDGAEYVGFETLLRESDVLSLNLPLTTQTHHLIDHPEFSIMKQGVIIINTARGAIINESALVQALSSGRVATAGLDVFEFEPRPHPSLLENPRVLLLPHMGTYTEETMTKMEEWAISNVRLAVTERRLRSIVPEQRYMDAGGISNGDGHTNSSSTRNGMANGQNGLRAAKDPGGSEG